MKNALNPKWLLVINTLPIAALFVFFIGQFNIIKSLLNEESIRYWIIFGLILFVLGSLNLAYSIFSIIKKKNISILYGIIALLCYIPYIYMFYINFYKIIPGNIPFWMTSSNVFTYIGTFLMPTLIYSIFILVFHLTDENKKHKAWLNFLIAISIPVICYLSTQALMPLWRSSLWALPYNFTHIIMIFAIAATIIFLFFLIRSIFTIIIKKSAFWQKFHLVWKIPITIVFPVLGLLVNGGVLFGGNIFSGFGIFGNFSSIWFYILAVLNGILLCLPGLNNKNYRLALFTGRSITLTFSLYFFLVFLPFLPFSVLAIILAGTGFLLLTPLALFIIHVNEIYKDYNFIKSLFPKKIYLTACLLGILLIPACITITFIEDKIVLNKALEYLYAPDYSKNYIINKKSLKKTLETVKEHKSSDLFDTNQTPYLSSYFNWIVLNHLTLSDDKINYAESVFFGKTRFAGRQEGALNNNVDITNISVSSFYDASLDVWNSWVDLEIENKNDGRFGFWEYATVFTLPEGCWISDYYLYVEDIKEPGILAEKRAAMWVYSSIRNINRDPGILIYLTGNDISFRVFPFSANETRKTGIEFLHAEPVVLSIDGNIIELGSHNELIKFKMTQYETEDYAYVSSFQKQFLNPVKRKPYFHFLIDTSSNKKAYIADFSRRIDEAMKDNPSLAQNAQISFVNSTVKTLPLDGNWKNNYEAQTFEGGFFLERAIQAALYDAYENKTYPVIVTVTDDIGRAIVGGDFSNFKFTFPENDLFFNLDRYANLLPHSLMKEPKIQLTLDPDYSFEHTVLEFKFADDSIAYLPYNDEPGIVLKNSNFKMNEAEIKEKDWKSAVSIHAKQMSHTLHPKTANKEWRSILVSSFKSRILTQSTSYIVVENEAQRAMLKKKQEQALSGGKLLDLGETAREMSEPALWVLLILFCLAILAMKRKRPSFTGLLSSKKRSIM